MKRWLLVLAACGSDAPRTPTAEELQVAIARRVVTDTLADERTLLAEIRARKPGPTHTQLHAAADADTKAFLDCGLMEGMTHALSTVADPLMFDIMRVCHHELPLALLDAAVVLAEGPRTTEFGVCWTALTELDTARQLLGEPEPAAIVERIKRGCPKFD